MKRIIIILALVIPVMAAIIFTGYRSSSQKHNAAHTEMLLAFRDLNEASNPVNAEEWETFKSESVIKIRDLEKQIALLNTKIENQGELFDAFYKRTVTFLDEKNKYMKITLGNLEKVPTNWESFKHSFIKDMEATENTLKDLTVSNIQ